MVNHVIDETGNVYGRLTVKRRAGSKIDDSGHVLAATWLCRCVCGNTVEVSGRNLRRGVTRSCGCIVKFLRKLEGEVKSTNAMRNRMTITILRHRHAGLTYSAIAEKMGISIHVVSQALRRNRRALALIENERRLDKCGGSSSEPSSASF